MLTKGVGKAREGVCFDGLVQHFELVAGLGERAAQSSEGLGGLAHGLHGLFFDVVDHLDAEDERCATSDGCCDVDGFHHLFFIGAVFEAFFRVGVDTIGALDDVGNCQGNEGLFAHGESTFLKYFAIVVEKFPSECLLVARDFAKSLEILGVEVAIVRHSHRF